jgi:hypothetical protein
MINLGHRGQSTGRECYTSDDIDFVVAYVVAAEAWYIIPVDAIKGFRQLRLYPSGTARKRGGYFEQYREAWHLITGKPPAGSLGDGLAESHSLSSERRAGECRSGAEGSLLAEMNAQGRGPSTA